VACVGTLRGETHHALFPGFDLVLTRAGGGTVNDALASGVPLVLVEERGMWQVEQVRRACGRLGLARSVGLDEFRADPRRVIEDGGSLITLEGEKGRIARFPNHQEIPLVAALLAQGGGMKAEGGGRKAEG